MKSPKVKGLGGENVFVSLSSTRACMTEEPQLLCTYLVSAGFFWDLTIYAPFYKKNIDYFL